MSLESRNLAFAFYFMSVPEKGDPEAAVEAVNGRDPPQQLCADADRHRRPPQPGHCRVGHEEAEELRGHHGDVQAVHLLRRGLSCFIPEST